MAHAAQRDDRRDTGKLQEADEFQTQKRQERRSAEFSSSSIVGDTEHDGQSATEIRGCSQKAIQHSQEKQNRTFQSKRTGTFGKLSGEVMVDTNGAGSQGFGQPGEQSIQERWEGTERYPWQTGVWINCPDGKQRLTEPGICLLVDGHPERVGLLHSAGDAIVPQAAAGFIECSMEVLGI